MQPGQPFPPQGQPPAAAKPPNPAQVPGIILCVCALAIAIGTFTKSWVSASESEEGMSHSRGVGLLGMNECMSFRGEEGCKSYGWGDDKRGEIPGDIKAFGYLGFVAGLGAIGAAAAAGGMALSRNLGKIPQKPMLGVLGAASFTHAFFLVRCIMEDKLGKDMGPSYSGFLSLIGLGVAGFALKQMLGPQIAAAKGMMPAAPMGAPMGYAPPMGQPPMGQPPMGQPPMGQPMAPPPAQAAPMGQPQVMTCPRCQGQANFVAQYNRYFCNACQQYV